MVLWAPPAARRLVLYEPALGPMDLSKWLPPFTDCDHYEQGCTRPENVFAETGNPSSRPGIQSCRPAYCIFGQRGFDGVIAGAETGRRARPAHPDWFRQVRDDCAADGVPFFFKSWRGFLPYGRFEGEEGRWDFYVNPDGSWGHIAISDEQVVSNYTGELKEGWHLMSPEKKAGRLLDHRTHDELPEIGS